MAIIERTVVSTLNLGQSVTVSNSSTVPTYGTVEQADNYFSQTLEGQRWMHTPREKKFKALVSATKRINRLNFSGYKAQADQPLQFPRGTDTLVPVDIQQACFELAQVLLKGVDPDTEADNALVTLQGYGGLRTEFDRSSHQPWMLSGIPNKYAWDLLWPYLDDVRGIELVRVS